MHGRRKLKLISDLDHRDSSAQHTGACRQVGRRCSNASRVTQWARAAVQRIAQCRDVHPRVLPAAISHKTQRFVDGDPIAPRSILVTRVLQEPRHQRRATQLLENDLLLETIQAEILGERLDGAHQRIKGHVVPATQKAH
ncbi:hypothetical protein CURTO8I2_70348 [Curtobacterium sp. 8I-2]|nr:hypothetical protein CURTO8I2_70348 [Curtobacterium sp. 8I-2]